jgi:hypothetical protein
MTAASLPAEPTLEKEATMATRKVIDCRLFPSEKKCTLTVSGTEEEVLTVAYKHAVDEHGHEKSPQLREQLRAMLRDE